MLKRGIQRNIVKQNDNKRNNNGERKNAKRTIKQRNVVRKTTVKRRKLVCLTRSYTSRTCYIYFMQSKFQRNQKGYKEDEGERA